MHSSCSILIALCLMLLSEPCSGQVYQLKRYADDNGLPSRIVRDVCQDNQGFIWVAGNNGLYRFDGKIFKGFFANLKSSAGLRDNKIHTVLCTRDGRVWAGTSKGLHQVVGDSIFYVPLLDNPSDNEEYITNLFEDGSQNLWISSYGGLFVMEKKSGIIHHVSALNAKKMGEHVAWSVTESKDGTIMVGRGSRHVVVSKNDDYIFDHLSIDYPPSLNDEAIHIYKLSEISQSSYAIDSNVGLLKAHYANDTLFITGHFFHPKNGEPDDFYIESSFIDRSNNLWIATRKNRFRKYKILGDSLLEQEVNFVNGDLDMSGNVKRVFEDAQKNVWMANTNGLYKLTKEQGRFQIFPPNWNPDCLDHRLSVYSVIEDANNFLWVTTPTKVFRLKKEDVISGNCPEDYLSFSIDHNQLMRYSFIDSENRLWLSGDGGLSVTQLDEHSNPGAFTHFTEENGLTKNWTFEVLEEERNSYWIGNFNSLLKLSLGNNGLSEVEFKPYNSDDSRTDALVNSYTFDLEKDANGQLWIGTFSGVSRLLSTEGEGSFMNYTSKLGEYRQLSNNSIKKIFLDRSGRIWIGTQTGLNLYNPTNDSFTQFGREDGLPSEYILGLGDDSKGDFWIVTTNGLVKSNYDENSNKLINVEHFTMKDGLADNISNIRALWIDREDNVFVGSSNGLSILKSNPDVVEREKFNLALSDIKCTSKDGTGFTSVKNRLEDGHINLSHFENSIQLTYVVLDFSHLNYNAYRHKLIPGGEDWIETGSQSDLTYYNLSPGKYELILDGCNGFDDYSEKPIHLNITIKAPPWKSNWAKMVYLIILSSSLWFLYQRRLRRRLSKLEQKNNLEKALIMEREQLRKENAADFHDELGSKVTKISLFLTLAERSIEEGKSPVQWFGKIRENITDLSGSFRDLLWVIDPQKDNLSDTYLRLKDFGEDLFNNTKVDFRTSGFSEEQMSLMLDPQVKKQLVLIFKEAMNNCAKYSEADRVDLNIEVGEKFFNLELRDNGKGFNVALKSKGRGLKNMSERSRKLDAHLSITSNGDGTIVRLNRIPHMSDET